MDAPMPMPMPLVPVKRFCVGGAVAYLRWKSKLSQNDLSIRLQMPRTYVSKVETGRREPTLLSLEKFAIALDVALADLVTISMRPEARIFRNEVAREVAKHCPLRKCQRNEIVRFINAHAHRRSAAA